MNWYSETRDVSQQEEKKKDGGAQFFLTSLDLLASVTTRKKIFDVVFVATLKNNGITRLYTVNVNDFK
ncbi:MAG: hypothetical protein QME42_09655 [bacterium]|nr:hypothetical protein [bacterium]